MDRWFDGSLVRWIAGSMDRWFDGSLVRWMAGSKLRWIGGSMDRWFDGSLVRWIVGSMDHWFDGSVDRWFDGSLVWWMAGSMLVISGDLRQFESADHCFVLVYKGDHKHSRTEMKGFWEMARNPSFVFRTCGQQIQIALSKSPENNQHRTTDPSNQRSIKPAIHRTSEPLNQRVTSPVIQMCRTRYEVTSPVTWYVVHQPLSVVTRAWAAYDLTEQVEINRCV